MSERRVQEIPSDFGRRDHLQVQEDSVTSHKGVLSMEVWGAPVTSTGWDEQKITKAAPSSMTPGRFAGRLQESCFHRALGPKWIMLRPNASPDIHRQRYNQK